MNRRSRTLPHIASALVALVAVAQAAAQDRTGSRFAYLDERDPYYAGLELARLTTPMWMGEAGVDAAVQLSIDDMGREHPPFQLMRYAKPPQFYYEFLLPTIERLQRIDGRAPVSIYALQVDADDPWLRRMLAAGISIEAHTYTHPVPYLRVDPSSMGGDTLSWCIRDFLDCVSGLSGAVGTRPVAWRIPGSDARNTTSPRFYTEVFPRVTRGGDFLAMDSSIFSFLTSADRSLPRSMVLDDAGRERFSRFAMGIPFTRKYFNSIANYPYPYVINGLLWELPVLMPGDAHGVHAYGANNPRVLDDWQHVLDATVHKLGLYTLCFHPHGYCLPESVAGLVEYADRKYGRRVRFLNCREILDRLNKNLLAGSPLRSPTGADNGVRLLDVDGDGFLDVVIGNSQRRLTRVWQPEQGRWLETALPVRLVRGEDTAASASMGVRFFTAAPDGRAGLAIASVDESGLWHFEEGRWILQKASLPAEVDDQRLLTIRGGIDRGVRFRDLNGDGNSDLIVNNDDQNAVFLWDTAGSSWRRASWSLPQRGMLVDADGADQGLRFVDLDLDGDDDLIFSNERQYAVYLFDGPVRGWATRTICGKANDAGALPLVAKAGHNMGVWFHSGAMVQANEFNAKKPDLVDVRPFADLLQGQGSTK